MELPAPRSRRSGAEVLVAIACGLTAGPQTQASPGRRANSRDRPVHVELSRRPSSTRRSDSTSRTSYRNGKAPKNSRPRGEDRHRCGRKMSSRTPVRPPARPVGSPAVDRAGESPLAVMNHRTTSQVRASDTQRFRQIVSTKRNAGAGQTAQSLGFLVGDGNLGYTSSREWVAPAAARSVLGQPHSMSDGLPKVFLRSVGPTADLLDLGARQRGLAPGESGAVASLTASESASSR